MLLKSLAQTAIPMHMALFNIPLKIALSFEIPLVVWGENSAFEYGGSGEERTGFKLDSSWFKSMASHRERLLKTGLAPN